MKYHLVLNRGAPILEFSNNACPYFFGLSTKSGLSNFNALSAQHHLVRTQFLRSARFPSFVRKMLAMRNNVRKMYG